jgi:hypothetical protein
MEPTLEQRLANIIKFLREDAVCPDSVIDDYCALEAALNRGDKLFRARWSN